MNLKVKYSIDFVVAVGMGLVLLPLFIILALLIVLEDGGSPFYMQPGMGQSGKTFYMYKLRSMKVNAPDLRSSDGGTYNAKDDPRVTRLGRFIRKTSLDELPQIINIIKGEMSFIGPRPDLPDQISLYQPGDEKRLQVRPGITGYAQVMGRNSLGFRERFQYDIEYIENYSLLLDIKILVRTILVVLKRDNVHRR